MKKKFFISGGLALIALAVISGITILMQSKASDSLNIKNENTIKEIVESVVVYSDIIPVLEPHGHAELDSLLDDAHGVQIGGQYIAPHDMWVNAYSWELENGPENGIHHFLVSRTDQPSRFCTEGYSTHRELFVAGADTNKKEVKFTDGHAVFIPKGTPLNLVAVIHNPLPPYGPGGTYENVRIKLTLSLLQDTSDATPLDTVRLSAEEPACGMWGAFEVPANAKDFVQDVDTVRSSYTFESPATVVFAGGHIHGWEGGKSVALYLNDELVEDFVPFKAGEEEWTWVTPWLTDSFDVEAGDTVHVTATYDNEHSYALQHEAMGMIFMAFTKE